MRVELLLAGILVMLLGQLALMAFAIAVTLRHPDPEDDRPD